MVALVPQLDWLVWPEFAGCRPSCSKRGPTAGYRIELRSLHIEYNMVTLAPQLDWLVWPEVAGCRPSCSKRGPTAGYRVE